jgi:hypothetical protein
VSRREQLARAVRRHQQKQQQAPAIFVVPPYAMPEGCEPVATWALDRREPTEAELVAAFSAAGFSEEQAKAAAAKANKQSHPKPAR